MSGKFHEHHRRHVVARIEELLKIKLAPIGSRRKYLKDEAGVPYVIVGGSEDWHGIPHDVFVDARKRPPGKLIFAALRREAMKVYCGPLRKLIGNEKKLTVTAGDACHFNLKWSNGQPSIKEMPELRLELLAEVPYSIVEMATEAFSALSKEQREAVLKALAASGPRQ